MSLLVLGMWAAASLAQQEPRPRTDPGAPPDPVGGPLDAWRVLTIPGLPANATLGDVWASPDGYVYVWAQCPSDGVSGPEPAEVGEGERLPNPPGEPRPGASVVYRFNGARWTMMLHTSGETGVALFGSDSNHLFASTVTMMGEVRFYSFDGSGWTREAMPAGVTGNLHTMAGVPGDLWFRVDRVVLHHDGARLQRAFELPPEETPVRGLAYLEQDCLFVLGTQGHWLNHEGGWSEAPAGFPFGDVQDAWGMRDAQGLCQLFAVGSDAAHSGLKLWRFRETDAVTHAGNWSPVFADPFAGGGPGMGVGMHLWGVAENEVYATGVVAGEGHMLRFDGTSWVHLVPPIAIGTVHGVWGTGQGVTWFSTAGAYVVSYQRANLAPDVTQARPTVDRLWPPSLQLVPVGITGVVDPDGDAFSIQVTRVTQDEALLTDAHTLACPDAALSGSNVYLRAEHAAGGDGRTYDVEFTATDRLGATSTGHVQVFAPHFVDTPCAPDPTPFDALGPCPAPEPRRGPLDTDTGSGTLRVVYQLEESTPIHLAVYDVSGRLRATLAEGMSGAGAHEVRWDLGQLETGVYFVKLRARGPALVRRVIVMH